MATKKTEETIVVRPVQIKRVPIRIVGDTPLIVHAWSEKAMRMMLEAQQKTTKTKAREIRRPFMDFVDSMYWISERPKADTDEELEELYAEVVKSGRAKWGFKATAVKQAANSAAYRNGWVKNQMALRGAYFIETPYNGDLFEIKGSIPEMREDMVTVGMGSADIRYRAEFKNWYADLVLQYNENGSMTLDQIVNCIQAGGFSCGIGEWRPEKDGSYGMVHVATGDELK